jgi:predicted RNA-binding Zn-ribbon protein involved in translation (DUF1610 family)
MSDGFDLSSAIESGADAIRKTRAFLGVEREAFVCPDCSVACEETYTHDPQRAAFDGGASPAWECPECGGEWVREVSDESHTLDLYGRGME